MLQILRLESAERAVVVQLAATVAPLAATAVGSEGTEHTEERAEVSGVGSVAEEEVVPEGTAVQLAYKKRRWCKRRCATTAGRRDTRISLNS